MTLSQSEPKSSQSKISNDFRISSVSFMPFWSNAPALLESQSPFSSPLRDISSGAQMLFSAAASCSLCGRLILMMMSVFCCTSRITVTMAATYCVCSDTPRDASRLTLVVNSVVWTGVPLLFFHQNAYILIFVHSLTFFCFYTSSYIDLFCFIYFPPGEGKKKEVCREIDLR